MDTPLTAIVLDASALGGGKFDLDVISKWSQACDRRGSELWLPEPVVWELAEHAMQDDRDQIAHVEKLNRARRKVGSEPLPVPTAFTFTEFEKRIRSTGARVIKIPPDDALEALRDQALQHGAGSRKKGVKTGAIDSAWLRTVASENGGDFDSLLIVTGDRAAVEAVAEQLEVEPPRRIDDLWRMSGWLDDGRPAEDDEIEHATEVFLSRFIDEYRDEIRDEIERLNIERDLGVAAESALDVADASEWDLQDRQVGVEAMVSAVDDPSARFDPWLDALVVPIEVPVQISSQWISGLPPVWLTPDL